MIITICAMSKGCGEIGVVSMRQIKEVGADAPCTCWACGDDETSNDDCLHRMYCRDCAAILGYHQPAVIEDNEDDL